MNGNRKTAVFASNDFISQDAVGVVQGSVFRCKFCVLVSMPTLLSVQNDIKHFNYSFKARQILAPSTRPTCQTEHVHPILQHTHMHSCLLVGTPSTHQSMSMPPLFPAIDQITYSTYVLPLLNPLPNRSTHSPISLLIITEPTYSVFTSLHR